MKQDQPDVLDVLKTLFGGDVLMNTTSGRYLSDHIEELIAKRVAEEREACAQLCQSTPDLFYDAGGSLLPNRPVRLAAAIRARSDVAPSDTSR